MLSYNVWDLTLHLATRHTTHPTTHLMSSHSARESYDNSDFSEYETSPVPSMPVLGDKSSKYRKAAARYVTPLL